MHSRYTYTPEPSDWFDCSDLVEFEPDLPRFDLPDEEHAPFSLVRLVESDVPDTALDPLPCRAVGLP
jgi:hypothetical protein